MKAGIIGGGFVGISLGKALLKAGHEVMFSSRDPNGEHARKIQTETGAPVGTVRDVLSYSNLIAIALAPDAAMQVAQEHAGDLHGKTIIDMNNRFGASPSGKSFAQDLAQITGAAVVKAFNTIGAEHYLNPVFEGQKATMFIAGDNTESKQQVGQLAASIGFDVVDTGSLESASLLEKLAQLWVHLARSGLGREIAFKLLKR